MMMSYQNLSQKLIKIVALWRWLIWVSWSIILNNGSGNLTFSLLVGRIFNVPNVVDMPTRVKFIDVVCGFNHSIILADNGNVYSMGMGTWVWLIRCISFSRVIFRRFGLFSHLGVYINYYCWLLTIWMYVLIRVAEMGRAPVW